jgi:hypothetical protein
MPLKPALLRAIWACAREHNVSNEEVHDAIQAGFSLSSVKDLTDAQAHQLLDGLRGKRRSDTDYARRQAAHYHGRRGVAADPTYLANQAELDLAWRTAANLGWSIDGFNGFVERQLGRSGGIRTMAEFNKVMWALKAIQRRDQAKYQRAREAFEGPPPAA